MKNIYLIPTDKPSSIWINYVVKRLIYGQFTSNDTKINCQNQNIYITSDEKIKEGDYVLYEGEVFKVLQTGIMYNDDFTIRVNDEYTFINDKYSLKIILTTDADLIKDSVQSIPDEFLEWFVKNPSCEEVEIVNKWDYNNKGFVDHIGYKINLPKEEPKQELERGIKITHVGKQETLEEAKKYAELSYYGDEVDAFVRGVKWQQEQDKKLYSEEEVIDLLYKRSIYQDHFESDAEVREWFEKFKKK